MCFNPRPRVGGDYERGQLFGHDDVSTHAPAWGATATADEFAKLTEFQPTPPRGGRRLSPIGGDRT